MSYTDVRVDDPRVTVDDPRVTVDGQRPFASPDGTIQASATSTGSATVSVTVGAAAP